MSRLPPRLVPADAADHRWRLSAPLRAATRAFAEALFSDGASPPPADRLDWMLDEVSDFLAHSGPQARAVFQASILGITSTAPLSIGKVPPLARLSLADRVRAVERFEASPLGLAVLGAKAICSLAYYEHPDAAAAIGADGGCLTEERS